MKITILTICPEVFEGFLSSHVVERAVKANQAEIQIKDIRDYTKGSFRAVDDSPYGGGNGVILRVDAVVRALRAVAEEKSHVILLSPQGKPYAQAKARQLAEKEDLVLLCGHYEGIDHRSLSYVDEVISMGDFILTGGEIPAMAIADSVLRLLPGVLKEGSGDDESFENGLLEYPQYTHPAEFEGLFVPEVLLSCDHGKIKAFRQKEALRITQELRPDLISGTQSPNRVEES